MRAGTSELEYAESIGDTLESAIGKAVDILGAREDEVDVEILQTGRRGFLWFLPRQPYRVRVSWRADDQTHEEIVGAEGAQESTPPISSEGRSDFPRQVPRRAEPERVEPERVEPPRSEPRRVTPRIESEDPGRREAAVVAAAASDPTADAERFARELFERLGISARVDASTDAEGVRVRIAGEEAEGFLADRDGEIESAIQVLTHRVLSRRAARAVPVAIDMGSGRSRQDADHGALALRLAEEVAKTGQWVETDPLPSASRRIVHRVLADHPSVSTESQGRGLLKRVRIFPK